MSKLAVTPSEVLNVGGSSDGPVALPPFSFSKKPVDKSQSISTDSNITSRLSRGSSKADSVHSQPTEFKDFDYNEQIRFPRMVNSHYTYSTKRSSFSSGERVSAKSRMSSFEEGREFKLPEQHHQQQLPPPPQQQQQQPENDDDEEANYKPAAFDLTQPMRRLSKRDVQTEEEEQDSKLLQEYTKNNCIYNSSNFNLYYQMKKPMMTPAVLRPVLPQAKPTTATYTVINVSANCLSLAEPSHNHWKPNSNFCSGCKIQLHNSLMCLIYDVPSCHHCRFCGLCYCASCLSESIVDKFANFVIPVKAKIQLHHANDDSSATMTKSKTCLKCTLEYENLTRLINHSDNPKLNITEAYVIVENPYTHDFPNYCDNLNKFKKFRISETGDLVEDSSRRRVSVAGEAPNVWTWSSF
ncbi:uncharacterized protein LODBEIA_P32750 [Lodderomyces beijingensis]|uniref:FYVE-type domain-containing protein n=1 Tax=Lodderomyces beijingensis TaxID=1775926 RepID=A0ABP0ZPJ8_9ASCO